MVPEQKTVKKHHFNSLKYIFTVFSSSHILGRRPTNGSVAIYIGESKNKNDAKTLKYKEELKNAEIEVENIKNLRTNINNWLMNQEPNEKIQSLV